MSLDRLTEKVVFLCRQAGQYLLQTRDSTEATLKGSNDLVTQSDRGSEEILIPELGLLCPEASILSEENGRCKKGQSDGLSWVIDPLDGTVNYSVGIPFFSVSVALLKGHTPLLGVVYAPALDELFTARAGKGAYLNGKKLSPLGGPNRLLKIMATSAGMTESDFSGKKTSYHESLLPHFNRLRLMGSQALHLCYVAARRLDAALTNQAKLWDDAAGSLVLEEVGGQYRDFSGKKIFPLKPDSALYEGKSYASIGSSSQKNVDQIVELLTDHQKGEPTL